MLVYLLLNVVNGKTYVGQTRAHILSRRWCAGLCNSCNRYLRSAIRKHGAETFSRDVLAETSSQDEADGLERGWIAILRSNDRRYGYNLDAGGKSGPRHSEETKKAIRENVRLFWQNIPPEKKNRHAANCKRIWSNRKRKVRMIRRVSKAIRLWWQSRTADQRQRIRWAVGASKRNRPTWNKGKRVGPHSEDHRRNISNGLRRYWAKRGGNRDYMRSAEQKGMEQYMTVHRPKTSRVFMKLSEEAVEIIQQAFDSLERGGSTQTARLRLKEIGRQLQEVEAEYKACNW